MNEEEIINNVMDFLEGLQPYYRTTVMYHKDSVLGSQELLVEIDGAIKKTSIKKLFDSLTKQYKKEKRYDGKEICYPENTRIFSVRKRDGKVVLTPIKSIIKNKVDKKIVEIKTETGKSVKVTNDHSLITLRQTNLTPEKPENLKDWFIATPSSYPINCQNLNIDLLKLPEILGRAQIYHNKKKIAQNQDNPFNPLIENIKDLEIRKIKIKKRGKEIPRFIDIDKDLATFFGLWIADGCYNQGSTKGVMISTPAPECQKVVKRIAKRFNANIYPADKGITPYVMSVVLKRLMESLAFKGKARTKNIPSWIFSSPVKIRQAFLRGYFSGDGTVSKGYISALTFSSQLAKDIQTLLLTLGIRSLIRDYGEHGERHKIRITDSISKEKFKEKIGFLQKKKNDKIKIGKNRLSGTLPLESEIIKKIVSNMDKKHRRLYSSYLSRTNLQKKTIKKMLKFCKDDKIVKRLSKILNFQIRWEKIDSIESISSEDPVEVYDIETKEGNFICQNMILKNTDGICSAILLMKFLESEYGLKVYSIYSPISKKYFTKNLQRIKTNTAILVDLACEKYEEVVDLSQRAKVLILDHHQFQNDINGSNLVYLNTKMISKKYYPASKLVYDLLSRKKDMSDLKWIAAVGTIADKGYKVWKDFIDETYKEFDMKKENLFLIPRIIGSTISMNKTEEALKSLKEIKDPKEFLEGSETKKLREYYHKMERELKRITEEVEKVGKNVLLELSTDYNIRSLVATTLEDKYKKKVIILQEEPKLAALSLRGENSLKTAEKLAEGLPNTRFGGHPKASGVKFPKDHIPIIKKRASDLLNSKWIQV